MVTRRDLVIAATGAFAMTKSAKAHSSTTKAAMSADPFDPKVHVHPELQSLVPMIQEMTAHNAKASLAELRAAFPNVEPAAQPIWVEHMIPGPAGAPDVRVYVINGGNKGAPRPGILHIHGGGYVRSTAKHSVPQLQPVATALDCVIVTVDYRLAPETPFPGSLEDNYAGLKWLYQNAAELGIDLTRVAVMGESAGGGHAAMLAIAARDRGEFPLMYQALIYPMIDDRTGTSRKVPPHIGALVWPPERNRAGWTALLGVPAGGKKVPEGAVPSRVENLKGLPPAFIGVGGIDLFVDEDIEYARRLNDVGVPTELVVVPGAFHGFDSFAADTSISKQFRATLLAALGRAFKKA
jgi:acetyl esterase/lipase